MIVKPTFRICAVQQTLLVTIGKCDIKGSKINLDDTVFSWVLIQL